MIPANVKKVFEENLWFVATCSDEPHVIPVGFKGITEDGKFTIGAVLLETTLKNIEKNGKIAVAACDPNTMESYQMKGTAEFVTEGPVFDQYVKLAEDTFKGAHPAKGALVITPDRIIVASPSEQNKQEIPM